MTGRTSLHVEPSGVTATARHYLRDLVYGANDGIITTFAVVAGVTGGDLPPVAAVVVGVASLAADGLSMGVGNVMAIRASESARAADALPEEEARPWRHGVATFAAFVAAGAVPLAPYLLGAPLRLVFPLSVLCTLVALFAVGAGRGLATNERWWRTGGEMLALGVIVAGAAYAAAAVIAGAV